MTLRITIAALLTLGFVAIESNRRRALCTRLRCSRAVDANKGPVEYCAAGSGPAVLLLLGGAGGWDQGIGLGVSLFVPDHSFDDYHATLHDADAVETVMSASSSRNPCAIACHSSLWVRFS